MTRALPLQSPYFATTALLAVAIVCCSFFFAAPAAHASSLTEAQIQAVENLVASYGADRATVTNVDAALRSNNTARPASTGTPSGSVFQGGLQQAYAPYVTGQGYGSIALSGDAYNVSQVQVVLIHGSFITDSCVVALDHTRDGSNPQAVANAANVVKQGWTVPFQGITAGQYTVYLCEAGRLTLLQRTTLTVTVPSPASSSLTVSTDTSSPAYQIVAGGSTGVTVGVFDFTPSGENMLLNKIGLKLTGGSPADISTVSLYSGSRLLGTAVFSGNLLYSTSTLTSPVTIAAGALQVTVKADFNRIGTGQPATPGDLVKIDVANYEATGQNSGVTVRGTASTNVAGARIFRSYPIVRQVALPTDGLSDGRLLRFGITATPAGDIGISQLGFTITQAPLGAVTNVSLYEFADAGYSSPVNSASGLLASAIVSGSGGFTRLAIQPAEIPAGGARYFELRGTGTLTGRVSAMLDGENGYQGLSQYNTAYSNGPLMAWSPNDYTTSQYSDTDWTNAYQLAGLGSGISQTRTAAAVFQTTVDCAAGYHVSNGSCIADPVAPAPVPAPTVTLSVNGQSSVSLTQGAGFTLAWSSQNAQSCSLTYAIGSRASQATPITPNTSGSSAGAAPEGGVQYTLACTNSAGQSVTKTATVIATAPPPTCTISVSPSTIQKGGTATLSYTTQNATSLDIAGVGSTGASSGSTTVSPPADATYYGTVYGAGGTGQCQTLLKVSVAPASSSFAFLSDYSDAFNGNLAAVMAAPYDLVVDAFTNFFVALGVR